MTVETTRYMDHVRSVSSPDEPVYFEIENGHNNENIYPMKKRGQTSTVFRPQCCTSAPLFSRSAKMNPHNNNSRVTTNELLSVRCGGKDVLASLSSPVNRSIDSSTTSSSSNLSSPVKRSCTSTDNLLHSPKAVKVLSPRPSTPSSSSLFLQTPRLSHSVDSTSLHTALKHIKSRADGGGGGRADNLSASCFADITSDKKNASDNPNVDNDLTCLNWLQGSNLLREFSPSKSKSQKEAHAECDVNNANDFQEEDLKLDTRDPLSCNASEVVDVQTTRKPAYSFSALIFMAIESSPNKQLPVKDIYQWVSDKFPYFQQAPTGWKNSIRHNLSLNKSFKKVSCVHWFPNCLRRRQAWVSNR